MIEELAKVADVVTCKLELVHLSIVWPEEVKLVAVMVVMGFREKGFLNLVLVMVTRNT